MLVTVLPPDKVVIVNGKPLTINTDFPKEIAGAYWDGANGKIVWAEPLKEPAKVDLDWFKPWHKIWTEALKQEEAQEVSRKEKLRQEEEIREAARDAKRTPLQRLMLDPARPTDHELLLALVLAVANKKPARLNAFAKQIEALASKYGVDIS